MLDETIKTPDPSFKPARKIEPGKKKFGDGLAALAKNDPVLLAKLAASPGGFSSLGADFVMSEIKAVTKAKGAKKRK